jgi:hypothetical protein
MTKTENYQLTQWEAEDTIQREVVNRDSAKIDQTLAQTREQAELGAGSTFEIGTYEGNGLSKGDGGTVVELGWKQSLRRGRPL